VRGFEVYENLPEEAFKEALPTTTTLPRAKVDVARAVRFLLQNQRNGGVWDDSQYNYGGDNSLPNVYMADTALAALALRAWGEPKLIETAITRAEAYMKDESKIAADDGQEIAWAHAYRLLYFAKTGDKAMMARLVKKLAESQKPSGVWQHEYDNPFVTATILHVLDEARAAGAEVPAGVTKRGVAALKSTRDGKGVFSYEFPGRGGAVEGAFGRMPYMEHVLGLYGQSKPESLAASLDTSFKHHPLLERIRKYDDHADAWHNGGFFFWYDQYGRAVAAKASGNTEAMKKQRDIVLQIPEIDGCWVDSHELGRVYGTAMALLTLKLCGE
jgi:squalene cyclase